MPEHLPAPPDLRVPDFASGKRIVVVIAQDALGDAEVVRDVLAALAVSGQQVGTLPASGAALVDALVASVEESFPRSDYGTFYAGLPKAARDEIWGRWGEPEKDARFRPSDLDCGSFAIAARRFGDVWVAIEPPRTEGEPPRHGFLAFHAWIADGVRAAAILRIGAAGRLVWLPVAGLLEIAPRR